MTYDEFKNEIVKSVQKKLDETAGAGRRVETRIFDKVNRSYEGLCICDESKGPSSSPVFSIGQYYDEYMQGRETDRVTEEIIHTFMNTLNVCDRYSKTVSDALENESRIRDNIIFQLINTEQNRDVLSGVPHREFEDLSVIYRWIVKEDGETQESVIVNNKLADALKLDEEQLFKLAFGNTRRMMPPVVKTLGDVINEMLTGTGLSEEYGADMVSGNLNMWIMSNDRGINGAAVILYDDVLYMLSERLGEDMYILPSSVHEVMAVPASLGDADSLAMMVTDINMAAVMPEERLSNQVYHYDRDLRKLSVATCTQYTKLEYPVSPYKQGR